MAISIILADTDEDYMRRLESYILSKGDDMYEIIKYTDKAKLKSAVDEGKYDILLFSPDMYDKGLNCKKVKVAIAIYDEDDLIFETFKRSINKYTKITSMLEYITFQYEEAERNKPIIYGVYSPAGGVGKTTVALAVALASTKIGRKVFYLNTEDLDSTPLFFDPAAKDDLQQEVNFEDIERLGTLHAFLQTDSKTGIMFFNNLQELNAHAMTHGELSHLVQTIIDDEIASIVVIDLNTSLDNFNHNVFEIVDQLILVAGTGQSNYKLNRFLTYNDVIDPIKHKLKLVINQEKNFELETDIEIIGKVDTLYSAKPLANPLALSSYIAGKDFIKLA